jgi:hypothetical protein
MAATNIHNPNELRSASIANQRFSVAASQISELRPTFSTRPANSRASTSTEASME